MRKELNEIALIEQYLMQTLAPEEQLAFETRLNNEPALQTAMEQQQYLLEGIERIAIMDDIRQAQKNINIQQNGFYLGSVVIAIAVLFAGYNYITDEPAETTVKQETVIKQDETRQLSGKEKLAKEIRSIAKPAITSQEQTIVEQKVDAQEDQVLPVKNLQNQQISTAFYEEDYKLEIPRKGFQQFKIDPQKDTSLVGAEGTIIEWKANSFITFQTDTVTLRLKEYYQLSDIVYSDLITLTHDEELLESGGMVYLDAVSSTGESLNLKEKSKLTLKFPYDQKKEGMELYQGVKQGNESEILWKKQTNELKHTLKTLYQEEGRDETFTLVENMPVFPDCDPIESRTTANSCTEEKVHEYVKENMRYPMRALEKRISGTVYVRFIVNETGFVSHTKVTKGVDPLLNKEALRIVKSLPRFFPGRQRGKPVKVQHTVPVKFRIERGTHGYTPFQINEFNEKVMKEREIERLDYEDRVRRYKADSVERRAKKNMLQNADYYVFSNVKFGWTNCDRPFPGRGRRIDFVVSEFSKDIRLRLIFHRTRTIVTAPLKEKGYHFKRMPLGEEVSIFAVKIIDKQPHVSWTTTEVSEEALQLNFKPLKEGELQNYVQEINAIAKSRN